jgi:hypothetical protein
MTTYGFPVNALPADFPGSSIMVSALWSEKLTGLDLTHIMIDHENNTDGNVKKIFKRKVFNENAER